MRGRARIARAVLLAALAASMGACNFGFNREGHTVVGALVLVSACISLAGAHRRGNVPEPRCVPPMTRPA